MKPAAEPVLDENVARLPRQESTGGPSPLIERRSAAAPYVAPPTSIYQSLLETVSTTFLAGARMLEFSVKAQNHNGETRVFDYGFRLGRPGRSLIFLIPGFGCPFNDRMVSYMSGILQERGQHVVILHSPSHPEFLIKSHHSGTAGITTDDSRDLLLGIGAIRAQLDKQGLLFADSRLIGYSMGALNAAFVRHLDHEEMFKRVVLVNPPVNMQYGTSQLDDFVEALNLAWRPKAKLVAKVGLAIVAPKKLRHVLGIKRERLIKYFLSNPIWTELELRALIGHAFAITISGGLQAAAALKTLPEGHSVRTFSDYCNQATMRQYRKVTPLATTSDLFRDESLLRIGESLGRDPAVHLIHNENDFLLRPQDVRWLKTQFGKNAHLFADGGHLGNVWRPEFHEALATALAI